MKKRNIKKEMSSVLSGIQNYDDFDMYLQPRINTALNKQVFVEYLAEKLNDTKNFKVYFNPNNGEMMLNYEDASCEMTERKKFHEFVSGKQYNINIDLFDEASNYRLKKDLIYHPLMKEKMEKNKIFNISLSDAVRHHIGDENALKMRFAYLFNTSLYVERSDKTLIRSIKRALESKGLESEESRNLYLMQKTFMNGVHTSDLQNPFELLDDISDLINVSLKVYYEPRDGMTPFMDPKIMLFDEKNELPLYRGESVLTATEIVLKKFNNEYHPKTLENSTFDEKVTTIAYCEYLRQQVGMLSSYLMAFTPTEDGEVHVYETFWDTAKKTEEKYWKEENAVLDVLDDSQGFSTSELNLAYAMLDEIGALQDNNRYVTTYELANIISDANKENHKLKEEMSQSIPLNDEKIQASSQNDLIFDDIEK